MVDSLLNERNQNLRILLKIKRNGMIDSLSSRRNPRLETLSLFYSENSMDQKKARARISKIKTK